MKEEPTGQQSEVDAERMLEGMARKQFDLLQERDKLTNEVNRLYVLAETRQLGIDTVTKHWADCVEQISEKDKRIAELEAALKEANKLIDWYEGDHKATKP